MAGIGVDECKVVLVGAGDERSGEWVRVRKAAGVGAGGRGAVAVDERESGWVRERVDTGVGASETRSSDYGGGYRRR